MKYFKYIGALFFIFFISLISWKYYQGVYASRPDYDGVVVSKTLNFPTRVVRDSEGIPHIYAKSRHDLYFTLGQTVASDRLFQMDIVRRVGAGRLSEILGKKTLKVDKLFRTLGSRYFFEEKLKTQKLNPEMVEAMKSFFEGVNEFIKEDKLPLEFQVLGYRPEPFSVADAYGFVGYMAYGFSVAFQQDPLFTKWEKTLGKEIVDQLRVEPSKSENLVSLKFDSTVYEKIATIIEDYFAPFEGSNAWVLGPKKTRFNNAILASDPHISFSNPGIWYEAHLVLESNNEDESPLYEMYGHFLPLLPFPALGHNHHYGWGLTMSYVDDMDLYKEEIKDNRYLYDGKWFDLKSREELIRVRAGKDVVLSIKETRNGPLLNEVLGQNLSLKWLFLNDVNRPVEAFYRMNHAKSMEEFQKATDFGASPGLNVLYGDSFGNIAHFLFGQIPLRKKNLQNDFVFDGTSSHDDYIGLLDLDKKPFTINPKSGVIVSANNRIANTDRERIRGWWQVNNRHDTISHLLDQRDDWTIESLRQVQTSTFDLLSLKDRDELVEALSVFKFQDNEGLALKLLKKWDGKSEVDSVGATIFHQFAMDINEMILDEVSKEDYITYCKTQAQWHFFQRVIRNEKFPLWDFKDTKEVETRTFALKRIFKKSISKLERELGRDVNSWHWGQLHKLTYPHPLGVIGPLKYLFNIGPVAINGGMNSINHNRRVGCKTEHNPTSGPSTRRLIDFSNSNKSFGILPLGVSGHPKSPYYENQKDRFIEGSYRFQLLSKELIEKNKAHEKMYLPEQALD